MLAVLVNAGDMRHLTGRVPDTQLADLLRQREWRWVDTRGTVVAPPSTVITLTQVGWKIEKLTSFGRHEN